jgi:hypothetical protein
LLLVVAVEGMTELLAVALEAIELAQELLVVVQVPNLR